MESVKKIETSLENLYKNAPHLPKELTKFLAEWAWLFTLIGVVLGVLGVVTGSLALVTTINAINYISPNYASTIGGPTLWLNLGVSLLFSVVIIFLQAQAITPLKEHKKRGWDLIFLTLLVSGLSSVVTFILSFLYLGAGAFSAVIGLAFSFLWLAIGAYVLFEVKGYFGASIPTRASKSTKKPEALSAK